MDTLFQHQLVHSGIERMIHFETRDLPFKEGIHFIQAVKTFEIVF